MIEDLRSTKEDVFLLDMLELDSHIRIVIPGRGIFVVSIHV